MIPVEKARDIVFGTARSFGIESVSLMESIGRILQESLVADRDFPPYNRVTMDGIAIRYSDFMNGTRRFKITGVGACLLYTSPSPRDRG